jgi:hypothetical protein
MHTSDEQSLIANTDVRGYIQSYNARRCEQAKREGWEFWTLMPEDEAFVSRFENVYELEHMNACETFSDVFKEKNHFRPRFAYNKWTLDELEVAINELWDGSWYHRPLQAVIMGLGSPEPVSEPSFTLGDYCPELATLFNK